MELSYQQVYAMNKAEASRQLVHTYLQTDSIARTAKLWQTSRAVVRKWVRRFQSEGEAGPEDRSCRPHPAQVVQLRQAIAELASAANCGTARLGSQAPALPQHH